MKKYVQGATILEVMVSVFLLTFGILALMAAQVRSVASINEAEQQSIVAQAAEALAEAMQVNPTLTREAKNSTFIYNRRYTEYVTNSPVSVNMSNNTLISDSELGNNMDKAELKTAHIAEFESILSNQLVGTNVVRYMICRDKSEPDAPTLTGNTMTANCRPANNSTDVTAIKIAWRMDNNDGANNNGNVYTYMLQVAE